MLIHNADITGSLLVNGTGYNTGSFSGSFTGAVAGTTATASYVEYNSVANKPALVSGSSQIEYSGLTGIPSGIVSGSAQISGFGIFATTGSNQFNGSQVITGSLTVTGQVVAQTLNVQQVTSSIVYSSGSNIFGNSVSNTQQLTGSVGVTGSLTVAGAGTFTGNVSLNASNLILGLGNNANNESIVLSYNNNAASRSWRIIKDWTAFGDFQIQQSTTQAGATYADILRFSPAGAATFSSSVTALKYIANAQATYASITYEETFKYASSPAGIWFGNSFNSNNNVALQLRTSNDGTSVQALTLASTGAATFSSSISGTSIRSSGTGSFGFNTANNGEFQIYATAEGGLIMAGRGATYDMVITNKNGADTIRIPTGTTNVNFVGNVGVNTTSPGNFSELTFTGPFLDVAGIMQIKGTSANTIAALQFGGDTFRKALIYSSIGTEDPYLAFSVSPSGNSSSSSERMRITSGGNIIMYGTTTQLRLNTSSNISSIQFWKDSTPTFASNIGNAVPGNSATNDLVFSTYDTSVNWKERMRINSTGDIAFNNNGSSVGFYSQAVATVPGTNYYFNFLEALNNGSAASIKVGGILASDAYGIANPDRGDIYVQDNVSALSFTDRTPYPSSLELAKDVIKSHRRRSEEEIEELVVAAYNKIQNLEKEMPQPEKEALTFEEYKAKYRKEYELDHSILHDYVNDTRYAADGIESRDLSATVSCLVEVVKDLIGKVETLESEIQTLKQQ